MSNRKVDPTSDAARTDKDADQTREDLKKQAADGLKKAIGERPVNKAEQR
jgi:hypothetical protein